jgi:hypothetical protein
MMKKLGLTTRETAWVLGQSESQVRRLLAAGSVEYAVRGRLPANARGVETANEGADLFPSKLCVANA